MNDMSFSKSVARSRMSSAEHRQLPSSPLLMLLLISILSSLASREPDDNEVSVRSRDNSLSRFHSKATTEVEKDRKSVWPATEVDEGTRSAGSANASRTTACRNQTSQSSGLDKIPQGRVQQPDSHLSDVKHGQDVVDLMRSVSEQLSGLRSALQHLRLHSQAVHRQIKRLHRASCTAVRRARRRTRWSGADQLNRRIESYVENTDATGRDERNVAQLIPARHHHHRHRHHHVTDRCPAGFIYSPVTSTCYLLRGEQVTWDAADRHCRLLDAQLVSIRSSIEQRQLTKLARTNSDTAHCDFWIGLRRSRNKRANGRSEAASVSWRWTTAATDDGRTSNAATYGHWNSGEPNDAGGIEDCAQAMWVFSWRWNDTPCASTLACYACEASPKR